MKKQLFIFTLIIISIIIAGGISTKAKKYPANYNFVLSGSLDSNFRASPDSVAMYVVKSQRYRDSLLAVQMRLKLWAGQEDNSTLGVALDSTQNAINRIILLLNDSIIHYANQIVIDSIANIAIDSVVNAAIDSSVAYTNTFMRDSVLRMTGNKLRIQIPDTISAVVGDTLQIFYRGIIEALDPYAYHITFSGTKGNQFSRYYQYCPVNADTTALQQIIIRVYNDNQKLTLLASDTTLIKVQKVWTAKAHTLMLLGDSFTEANVWTREFYRRLTGTGGTPAGSGLTGITTIGNRGVAPNQCVGYGGKNWRFYYDKTANTSSTKYWYFGTHDKTVADVASRWSDGTNQWTLDSVKTGKLAFTKYSHTTDPPGSGTLTHVSGATHTANIVYSAIESINGNPFWDYNLNKVNIKGFCTRNSFADPEVVIALMTWNEVYAYHGEINDGIYLPWGYTFYQQAFMDSLHRQLPNCKLLLCPPTMPPLFGGMGLASSITANYGYYYGLVISIVGYNKVQEYLSKHTKYKSWVKLVSTTAEFDNEYGFTMTTKKT